MRHVALFLLVLGTALSVASSFAAPPPPGGGGRPGYGGGAHGPGYGHGGWYGGRYGYPYYGLGLGFGLGYGTGWALTSGGDAWEINLYENNRNFNDKTSCVVVEKLSTSEDQPVRPR